MLAPDLKTLIFADSVPTSCDSILWECDRNAETSKEKLRGYVGVFEKLHIGIGQVVVKIDQHDSPETDDEGDFLDISLD